MNASCLTCDESFSEAEELMINMGPACQTPGSILTTVSPRTTIPTEVHSVSLNLRFGKLQCLQLSEIAPERRLVLLQQDTCHHVSFTVQCYMSYQSLLLVPIRHCETFHDMLFHWNSGRDSVIEICTIEESHHKFAATSPSLTSQVTSNVASSLPVHHKAYHLLPSLES